MYAEGEVAPVDAADVAEQYETGIASMALNPTFAEIREYIDAPKSTVKSVLDMEASTREDCEDVHDLYDEFCGAMCHRFTRSTLRHILPEGDNQEAKKARKDAVASLYTDMGSIEMFNAYLKWLQKDTANVSPAMCQLCQLP